MLIVLGLLAASSLIAQHSADAGNAIERLRPLQGWVGVFGCIVGILYTVRLLFAVGSALTHMSIVAMIPAIAGPLLLASTGFLMGFGMISELLASSDAAQERAEALRERLEALQIPLGVGAVAVGLWVLLLGIF